LTGVASAAAAVALGLPPAEAISGELVRGGSGIQLDRVTVQDFAEHLGTSFQIEHLPGRYLEAELIKATSASRRHTRRNSTRDPFSLTLHVAQREAMPQNTYRVCHPVLGQLDLFLVPIGRPTAGTRLQAVFS